MESGTSRVEVRDTTLADSELLLAWRNDPVTRASSRRTDVVTRQEHAAWLSRVLTDPTQMLLVGFDDSAFVGTVRFSPTDEPDALEVSITLAPERRGQGLAVPLLLAGEAHLVAAAGPVRLLAFVKRDNPASARLFENASYETAETSESGTWYQKVCL